MHKPRIDGWKMIGLAIALITLWLAYRSMKLQEIQTAGAVATNPSIVPKELAVSDMAAHYGPTGVSLLLLLSVWVVFFARRGKEPATVPSGEEWGVIKKQISVGKTFRN